MCEGGGGSSDCADSAGARGDVCLTGLVGEHAAQAKGLLRNSLVEGAGVGVAVSRLVGPSGTTGAGQSERRDSSVERAPDETGTSVGEKEAMVGCHALERRRLDGGAETTDVGGRGDGRWATYLTLTGH